MIIRGELPVLLRAGSLAGQASPPASLRALLAGPLIPNSSSCIVNLIGRLPLALELTWTRLVFALLRRILFQPPGLSARPASLHALADHRKVLKV